MTYVNTGAIIAFVKTIDDLIIKLGKESQIFSFFFDSPVGKMTIMYSFTFKDWILKVGKQRYCISSNPMEIANKVLQKSTGYIKWDQLKEDQPTAPSCLDYWARTPLPESFIREHGIDVEQYDVC